MLEGFRISPSSILLATSLAISLWKTRGVCPQELILCITGREERERGREGGRERLVRERNISYMIYIVLFGCWL